MPKDSAILWFFIFSTTWRAFFTFSLPLADSEFPAFYLLFRLVPVPECPYLDQGKLMSIGISYTRGGLLFYGMLFLSFFLWAPCRNMPKLSVTIPTPDMENSCFFSALVPVVRVWSTETKHVYVVVIVPAYVYASPRTISSFSSHDSFTSCLCRSVFG